ncbi:LPXTG-motif cell wall-anchored protein [Nocardiopsis sp. Huas11]|uniref:LPXTG cell wall anchor domain-containing protein n=1 Tax=Nocardiopsis sp. Huas11 TaxID=2183912 RepID=UPI000F140131|nr:LPXTG cell wall anchor domain-containing protein [Nocardiopsis sp. Huas11]RKS05225.1 LPXTG-motif cell wall-anchored protein [Nocardiopsis sp. Huas11]
MSIPFHAGTFCARFMTGTAIVAAAVLGGSALASASPGDSVQVPNHERGDNGTVKIHDPLTPEDDRRNVPKVCEFQIAAFGFDAAQDVSWEITTQGGKPSDREVVLSDTIVLDDEGEGLTELQELPNGHYRLNWTFEGENGNGKHKVFKVKCDEVDPTEEPTVTPTEDPTEEPTETPTEEPTENPTEDPTEDPTPDPTNGPTDPAESDGPTDPAESDEPTTPADESGVPGESGGLPVTGTALAGLVAAGAVAIAGGGAAVYFTRKRRDTPADSGESTEG